MYLLAWWPSGRQLDGVAGGARPPEGGEAGWNPAGCQRGSASSPARSDVAPDIPNAPTTRRWSRVRRRRNA